MDLIVDFPRCHSPRISPPPRVSFADNLEMITIENLSFKHKDDLWFSSQEMNSFKHQIKMTLKSILSINMTIAQYAELNIQDTSAFMGLENYLSKDTTQEIGRRRGEIRRAILLEQQRQLDIGIDDPEAISILSEALSEKSRLRARMIGLLHDDKTLWYGRAVDSEDNFDIFSSREKTVLIFGYT